MSNKPLPTLFDELVDVPALGEKLIAAGCGQCGQDTCLPGRFVAIDLIEEISGHVPTANFPDMDFAIRPQRRVAAKRLRA